MGISPVYGGERQDKDIRWLDAKDEQVLIDDVVHHPGETLIPTLSRRGSGTVKVYVYSATDSRAPASLLAQKLAADIGAAKGRVVCFMGPEALCRRGTRVQLKDFTAAPCPAPKGPVRPFTGWSGTVRRSFATLAQDMAADGFAFLHDRMTAGAVGPVLVAALDGGVAGAIGPMEIRPDAVGAPQLMPQYFGVLPKHRGKGLGRLLWRAAMHWGQTHGAVYQLLQTEVGGASDRLCRAEGLTSLGFVSSEPA